MKFALSLLAVISVAQANFKSGSVSSYEKFNYGKFVTRMKAPDQKGTVASFFTYWDGPGFYPGGWNELDVEIVPSVEENPLSTNVIFGDGHNKLEDHDYAHSFNPHDDWHTYELEWTPDYISFSIDGDEIRHLPATSVEAVKFMNKAQSLRMNFWTPTFHSWGKGLDATDMPWYVLYDYVEVFTYNEHLNEFEFHWRDDFNAFDSGRWHKASGGFEANSSVFYPQNVYTSGGNLVIKMEPMDGQHHEGVHDPHGILHADVQGHVHSPIHHHEGREDSIFGLSPHHSESHGLHGTSHGLSHGVSHSVRGHETLGREVHGHQVHGDIAHAHGSDRYQHDMPRHHWTEAHKYDSTHHRVAQGHLAEEGHHEWGTIHHQAEELHQTKLHLHGAEEAHHADVTPVVHLKDEDLHKEEKTTEEHLEAGVHKATLHTMKEGEVDDHRAPSHYELLHKDAHTESYVEKPVVHHETPKHVDRKYHTEHETHAELDHAYDDQKDIEPVHFHEGAVLKAFDHPDSHDYAHTDFEALAKKRAYDHHYTEERHTLPYRSEYHTLLRPQRHRERETYRYEHETPHYWTGDETPRYAEYSRTDIHDGDKHRGGHRYAIEDLDEEETPFEHNH